MTYRIQFHKDFTLRQLELLIPYLQLLGVRTVYASPIFQAVPGSTHGYDALNANCINPEIGTEEALRSISVQLKAAGMEWLQDIVPNHMAYDSRNAWLCDVLTHGSRSDYAAFFDINWWHPQFQGRLMAPFLGETREEALHNRALVLALHNGQLMFRYHETFWPLQPLSYWSVLGNTAGLPRPLQNWLRPLAEWDERQPTKKWEEWKSRLAALLQQKKLAGSVQQCLQQANENPELLRQVAAEQYYDLCRWSDSDRQINYRRFFTVNGLICLNIQHGEVMAQHHHLLRRLLQDGVFQGLRIDHIDGLSDPLQYLQRLRTMAGSEPAIFVEKILEPGEDLPQNWPVQGTTGYDFLSLVNNLQTYTPSRDAFTQFYRRLKGDHRAMDVQVAEKKSYILAHHMKGELENLCRLFLELDLVEKKALAPVHPQDIRDALGSFLVHCPVYRYYGNRFPLDDEEADAVQAILSKAGQADARLRPALGLLEEVLLRTPHHTDDDTRARIAGFYQRCMQFTGPLMAKGVEDTLMYTDHRFIGHNEVGDSPASFGTSTDEFHEAMIRRREQWPLALNATATHDTKRGEDVRARLNVLTALGDAWLRTVTEWQQMNASSKMAQAPDASDEYFIYQPLAGAYPMPGEDDAGFPGRLQEYLQKALREAKAHSNWSSPDEDYEAAAKSFALALVDRHPRLQVRQSEG